MPRSSSSKLGTESVITLTITLTRGYYLFFLHLAAGPRP